MNIMTHLRRKLRTFARDTNGSYTVETVLILPILLWGMLATYTFVDGYRMQTLNLRATYTISDLLTRQWNPVDSEFLDGLEKYHEFLTQNRHDTSMRVTVVYFKEGKREYDDAKGMYVVTPDEHVLVWSYATDSSHPEITNANLATLSPTLPVLANADSAVIVETWMDYEPPFSIGLPASVFANRVVTSPRFVPQLLWSNTPVS